MSNSSRCSLGPRFESRSRDVYMDESISGGRSPSFETRHGVRMLVKDGPIKKIKKNTVLSPIKVNSNTIELTVHPSCFGDLDLLSVLKLIVKP